MVRVKVKKSGMIYPIGKILTVSKREAEEAVKKGDVEMLDEKYVEGVGVVEEITPQKFIENEDGTITNITEEETKKREAEYYKWKGSIERTPTYYTTKADLIVLGVPEYLWERLAEDFNFVKDAIKAKTIPKKENPRIKISEINLLMSDLSMRFANVFKEQHALFYKSDVKEIVEVTQLKHGDEKTYSGFSIVRPNRFVTLSEKYCTPYISKTYTDKKTGEDYDIDYNVSISKDKANLILASPQFEETIPLIKRIFSVPIPIIYEGKLTFPNNGYDERFCSWLDYNAPKITNPDMEIKEAKQIFTSIFGEFCFEGKQDYTNALAGFITPFLRGLFPTFTTRTPFFFYVANRERAGKDYLAGITGLVLEGQALDESPISDGEQGGGSKNDELRKKTTACMLSGRRRFHSANNKGKINNSVLEALLTSKNVSDRILGKNELAQLENEMDYSGSGNVGIRFTPDLANRCNFIKLFLDIEDANKRKFNTPNLHNWVLENRGLILSAIYCLIKDWINNGCKEGSKLFASFPEWAAICGGIMENAGYGSPCIANDEKLTVGGDDESQEIKALFELVYANYPEKEIGRKEIIDLINDDGDIMNYYDLTERGDQSKFGRKITKYYGRIFSEIRLIIKNPTAKKANRQILLFTRVSPEKDKKAIFGDDYKNQDVPTLPTLSTYLPPCGLEHIANKEKVKPLPVVSKVVKVDKVGKSSVNSSHNIDYELLKEKYKNEGDL